MNNIFGLYDRRSHKVVSLNIFEDEVVAYNHYFDLIERNRLSQPNLTMSDFSVLLLGEIDDVCDLPYIRSLDCKEVTREYIIDYYKRHPLRFDVIGVN